MKKNKFLPVAIGVALTLATSASVSAKSFDANNKKQLEQYFDALKDNNRFAGSIAIYEDGKPLFEKAIIVKDDHLVDSNQSYRYKIGSISKTFTTVLIFQMIEQGKLSLDTKLSEYFPGIANAKEISIQQMLNHHSGIYNFTNAEDFSDYFKDPQTNQQMVERIEKLEPAFKPGERAEYSNSNYLLLGYILEQVSGKDYGDLIAERIAKPLGLKATYLEQKTEPEKNEVYSYFLNDDKWEVVDQWEMSVADAAGALVSTTEELNIFFKALFDTKLISKESLATMISEQDLYGHGIFKRELDADGTEYIAYGHSGGIESFNSNILYFPEQKIGVTYLSNAVSYDLGKVNKTLLRAAFGSEIETPTFKELELTEDELKKYEGGYSSDTHPLDISVMVKDGKLLAQASGQGAFPLTAVDVDTFEFPAAGIEMKFDPKNKQFVIKQGPRADIFTLKGTEIKQVKVATELLEKFVGVYASDSFPLDIEIKLKDEALFAQATGQPEFPLKAEADRKFSFDLAGIVIEFEEDKSQLVITQHGKANVMTKK
ncbi:MAG: beta-lactamase family protein [Kangiellaceae bacterium]|nr:beta-lactamase family protein [Kangiellaceae bacterium]